MTEENIFKINTVSLEGPDLSGKTTLYNNLHKASSFRWDIRDRSSLSRVCFARQFERNVEIERQRLERELSNLNNRMIVLLPSFETLERRHSVRGDEIQTLEMLKSLYDLYVEEVETIKNHPGVLVLSDESSESHTQICYHFLKESESTYAGDVGSFACAVVESHEKNELSLECEITGNLSTPTNSSIMNNPLEGKYYTEILWDLENVIQKERLGLNPYGMPQDLASRRFYYSSDSCISSIHFMPREDFLTCHCVFRSTNVQKNAKIDIEFINFLVNIIAEKFFFSCKKYKLALKLNSAHIISD